MTKNVAKNDTSNYHFKDDSNAIEKKKMVHKKQHHDPNTTIKKPYKFGIPGGPIFERRGKVTKLIVIKHKKLNLIGVTMIGGKFAVKKTDQNPQESQKSSYLEIASRSHNDDATSLLLHLKTSAHEPAELDTKLPADSKGISDKV